MKSANTITRLWAIYGIFAILATVIFWRLFSLQIVHGAEYDRTAQRQYVNPTAAIFDRGSIFLSDKDGKLVSAATVLSGATLIANGTKITDADAAFTTISRITPLERDDFFKKIADRTDTYIKLAERIPDDKAKEIRALALPGFTLETDRWRYYPGGVLAANTVGFVAYNGDDLTGRYGLERYYNDVLSREASSGTNFFAEVFGELRDTVFSRKPREGDIVTTIEPTVQSALDGSLKEINEKWHPESAGAIVMNPKNGEVYAMSVFPSFDLNRFGSERNTAIFGNPLVESYTEMGSIIKPLIVAAGLDTGVITAKTTYNDTGEVIIDKAHIRNYDGKARGVVSMQEVLNQSLNVGMAFIAKKLGHDNVRSYISNYGLGDETGVDLPGEIHGLTDSLESPRDLEYATASFGQGIAMTPIETVRALASLGNGGLLINPHLVKEIDYTVGPTTKVLPNPPKRVLKKETSDEITRMLVEVVDKALANGKAKLEHHSIAAKTGTAQIALKDGRGYYDDRYLHSFFGYFPAYDPQFIVFYYQVYPKGARYASETLTEPFMDMSKFLINYYQVPPDR